MQIRIGKSRRLTLSDVHALAMGSPQLLWEAREKKIAEKSRKVLQKFVDDRLPVYGVSTQYGDDAYRVHIDGPYREYLNSLIRRQRNVIRALSCGMGDEAPREIVKATLLLRAQALAQGASGVRREIIEGIMKLLRNDILPIMYRYGSVGASGDLVPSSAIALVLMGEGPARYCGKLIPASRALQNAGMRPMTLGMKEGLAIVNGTSYSTAIAALSIYKLCHLLPLSLAAAASAAEAMLAMDDSYHPFIHEAKHHEGQTAVAKFIKECWSKSLLIRPLKILRKEWRDKLLENGEAAQEHVQDYYSLRGIAHGFGPFFENLDRATRWIEEEINSSNDNPLIDVARNDIHHGANFLSDYVAVACDHLRADVGKGSTWLHALLANLIHPRKNRGLPSNLVPDPEEHTGFKTIQLLAASLAIHNRSRTIPISSVMLPTEGDNQDMVSLGTHSAFDLAEVTENYARMTAIMLFASAQAIELRGIKKGGLVAQKIHVFVRRFIPFLTVDRPLFAELKQLTEHLYENQITPPWFTKP